MQGINRSRLQRGSCTTIKLRLYNYRVYSCTTKGVVVVRQQGVATRLGRSAELSGNNGEVTS